MQHLYFPLAFSMHIPCKEINRQKTKEKKNEKGIKKMKNNPSKAREYIDGCLTMRIDDERNTYKLLRCIEEKREKKARWISV